MRRTATFTALVLAAGLALAVPAAPAPAADPPVHTLSVDGTDGAAMYPAFEAGIDRYGVTTTDATDGTLTVSATTSEPDGLVLVDGRAAPGGTATLTGLTEGDEVSVWIVDSAGTERHTLVYLPAGFPTIDVPVDDAGTSAGGVFLTLRQWNDAQAPSFETVVDHRGVPTFVRSASATDFKMLPDGHFTSSEDITPDTRTGAALVEFDDQFHEVRRQETVAGLVDTDGHDSVTLPNGDRYLLARDIKDGTSVTDGVIQEVDADGNEIWRWDSGDVGPDHTSLESESVNDATVLGFPGDYAHINSIAVMADGNLLVSFRHLSAVLKIARHATDGFAEGEIMWKLGGRDSSFTFADGEGGPCAQHAASELPNGDILVYDNGSDAAFAGKMCIDPADRGGPLLGRPVTRVTEWSLTPPSGGDPGQASIVWTQDVDYGIFAGNAQSLDGGNTMVGWAAGAQHTVAEEIQPDHTVVWKLVIPQSPNNNYYTTYRAMKFVVPDHIAPQAHVDGPADGATFVEGDQVAADFTCTDRGGSSLQTCGGTYQPGDALDTSTPGTHHYDVVATDGEGGQTTVTRSYVVAPMAQPDARIRTLPGGAWVGSHLYGPAAGQTVRATVRPSARVSRSQVVVRNDGVNPDNLTVRGTDGSRRLAVRYLDHGTDVTRRVVAGTWRTPRLPSGASVTLSVVVTRLDAARPGDARAVTVRVTSAENPSRRDAVGLVVTSRR